MSRATQIIDAAIAYRKSNGTLEQAEALAHLVALANKLSQDLHEAELRAEEPESSWWRDLAATEMG